jgi:CubicO group peptidase (beta-lactamase class C family)
LRTRCLLLLSMAVAMLAACQPSPEPRMRKRMDEVVRFEVTNKRFAGSVLIAKDDHIVFSRGYGLANIEWNTSNTPTTKYRIGSVTKQFTAAAILLLEEAGKLKVEDSLKTHWPEAPAAWDKVTIFHLVTHTSGITDFGREEYEEWKIAETTAENSVSRFSGRPLSFEPGTQFSYSNSGYILLGYLIERISGKSYGDFLREKIFTPLGMKDSGVDSNSAVIPNRAAGYYPGPDDSLVNAPWVNMTFPHAAGAIYSTTEDLFRWTQGLFGGKLLSAASLKKMTTPFKDDYAFGIYSQKAVERKMFVHGGHIEGFRAALAYFPDEKITVAVLSNLNESDPELVGKQLTALLRGETLILPSERREIQLSADSLPKFTGIYEIAPSANAIVTTAKGKLLVEFPGDSPHELLAESATRFFSRTVDGQLDFQLDAKGVVTGVVLHIDGETHPAKRLAERVEVKVPEEVLRRYPGTYQFEPGDDFVMTLEDGRLMVQPTGQSKAQLFAAAEDHFFLKAANIEIQFTTNNAGRTTGLVLHQGGKEMKAFRQ